MTKEFHETFEKLIANVSSAFVGRRETVELSLNALFSGGHLLIVDLPGVGKTTLAKAIARSIHGKVSRIQFTPDLLPSDVTGISMYIHERGAFEFHPGPVFANVLLADEINRATPRTQSSLLEAMEEAQVSADGRTMRLDAPFFVIATQNPIEVQGTFPLPEAQLDRFMISLSIGYPERAMEERILDTRIAGDPIDGLETIISLDQVEAIKRSTSEVRLDNSLKHYILDISEATRRRDEVVLGASPRASLWLMRASRTQALFQGRDYVTPEDVKGMAGPVLAHRIVPRGATRLNLEQNTEIIRNILHEIPVPKKG